MLIALIVIIVLAILASILGFGKAIQLWAETPYEEDQEKRAEIVWKRRMQAKMLFCPSVFLFIFGLDLNSLTQRVGADLPHTLGTFLCLFFIVGLSILGFKMYQVLENDPDRTDEDIINVWIGISLYASIVCMMLLGDIIESEFLTPLNIGLAVLVTGMMMSKGINEIEFPGSEFIRAGIIFSVIGGVIFWHNFLGLNWF